jgi:7-cyano-7-deazaguanine reductase
MMKTNPMTQTQLTQASEQPTLNQTGSEQPGLQQLGRRSVLSDEQAAEPRRILETFGNPRSGRAYEIRFEFPEFTSICPVTGQPDFATIRLTYVPDERCVEMKSLKLYYFAFRNRGIFYEAVANTVAEDLVAVLSPRRLTLVADFAVRGGTAGTITVRFDERRGYVTGEREAMI